MKQITTLERVVQKEEANGIKKLCLMYLLLEIHSEQVFGLVLCFKWLDCFFHAFNLSIFVLTILLGSPNLAEPVAC